LKQLKRSSSKSAREVADFDALLTGSNTAEEYAQSVVSLAESEFGVKSIMQPKELARCKSARLNLSFTAQLFNANHGMEEVESPMSSGRRTGTPTSDLFPATVTSPAYSPVPSPGFNSSNQASFALSSPEDSSTAAVDANFRNSGSAADSKTKKGGKKEKKFGSVNVSSGSSSGNRPSSIDTNSDRVAAGAGMATPQGRTSGKELLSPTPVLTDTYPEKDEIEGVSLQGELSLEDLRMSTGDKRRRSFEGIRDNNAQTTKMQPVRLEHRMGIDDINENSRPEDDDAGVDAGATQSGPFGCVSGTEAVEAVGNGTCTTCSLSVRDIRLLQYRPAWAFHLLLRIFKLPYVCENIGNPQCGGFDLPVLCVGGDIIHENEAVEYLCEKFGCHVNSSLDLPCGEGLARVSQNEWLLCSFIETELTRPLRLYGERYGDYWAQEQRCHRIDAGAKISALWRLQSWKDHIIAYR
jgi:hypothetical protein